MPLHNYLVDNALCLSPRRRGIMSDGYTDILYDIVKSLKIVCLGEFPTLKPVSNVQYIIDLFDNNC